jgi:hypothetical protein
MIWNEFIEGYDQSTRYKSVYKIQSGTTGISTINRLTITTNY